MAGTQSTTPGPAAIAKAVIALAVSVALLAGIPLALIAVAGNPLPAHLPTLESIRQAFTSPDDGTLFLHVLALVAWIAWLTFTAAILLEIPAQLRGVQAPHLPGLGLQQNAAAFLIAAIAALFPAAGAAPVMATTPPSAAIAYTAPVSSPAPAAVPGTGDARTPPPANGTTYRVQEGDSLWRIAETQLKDATAWRSIADANYGRPQPGGGSLHHDHVLQPGWELVLPQPGSGSTTEGRIHVVKAGETLSQIAGQELGDPADYPAIARASTGIEQPGGGHLQDPSLIRPGWHLLIPAEDHTHDDSNTSNPSDTTQPDPGAETHDPGPAPSVAAAGPSATTGPAEAATPGQLAPAPAAAPASHASPAAEDDSTQIDVRDVRTAAGTGALLAAGILVVLGALRARQQHRRRPGQRIALPDDDTQVTEVELRAVEDPMGIQHIDAALRALAAHHRASGRPLPQLWAARLTGTHLELYLAEPSDLPSPWAGTEDGVVWSIPHGALPADSGPQDTRAPWPSLVTVGQDLEDAHLLLDLEHITTLAIEGTPSETKATLAALAIELATSVWAEDLLVTLVGCLPELTDAIPTGRLRHLASVDQLILDLEQRAQDVLRVLDEAGVPDILTARGLGVADDAWAPEIVLLPGEIPDELRDRLHAVLHQMPRVGVALVTGGGTALGEWSLRYDVTRPGLAQLQPAGISLHTQVLAEPELEQVLDLLHTTSKEAVPGPIWAQTVTAAEPRLDDIPAQRVPEDLSVPAGASHPAASNTVHTISGTTQPAATASRPGPAWPGQQTPAGTAPGDNTETRDMTEQHAPGRGGSSTGILEGTPDAGDLSARLPAFTAPPAPVTPEQQPWNSAGSGSHGSHASISPLTPREQLPPPPQLRLLGKVAMLNAQGPGPGSHLGRATTLVALLNYHRDGLTAEDIAEALSPAKRMAAATVWSLVSRTRRWLDTDPQGRPYLPRAGEGGLLRLHPGLRSDWDNWLDLMGTDIASTPTSQLMTALHLVTGTPISGVVRRHYGWAEPLLEEMISSIVDVAHEASRRAFLSGDPRTARTAAAIGRRVDPANELMWRAAIRAEYLAGGSRHTRPLVDELLELADELATDLEPETEDLIAEIGQRDRRAAGQ